MSTRGKQKRHPPGAAELEPLSRRCLQAAGALSLLLVLVVVNSLLNSGAASPFNPNPVAAAAERTQGMPGMRFDMAMRFSSEGNSPATMTGSGTFNGETNLASVVYHAKGPDGTPLNFDAVLSESAWYFRYPQFASKMPEGKEWVKLQGLPGQSDESKMGAESPEESLRLMGAAGTIRRAGHATVRKVPTTRYRVTLPAAELAGVLRSEGKDELAEQLESSSIQLVGRVHAEAFIDGNGIMRRIRTRSTAMANGAAVTTEMRMDFFDFGIKPDIQVPDDSQVYDLTPLLEEKLAALGQAS